MPFYTAGDQMQCRMNSFGSVVRPTVSQPNNDKSPRLGVIATQVFNKIGSAQQSLTPPRNYGKYLCQALFGDAQRQR